MKQKKSRGGGIKLILENNSNNPKCPHGPTLLFTRLIQGKGEEKFFACSACRDRKDCRFFHRANEEFTKEKQKLWDKEIVKKLPKFDHRKCFLLLNKINQFPSSERAYCHKCSHLFILNTNETHQHSDHEITLGINDYLLKHPSELLKPLNSSKKEAQYLFSKEASKTLISLIKNLNIKHVLCIGAPRIHEQILSDWSPDIDSLLLDIDYRYHSFHGPLQFCWFNCFNNYFFNNKVKEQVFMNYLQQDGGENFLIITDPPFGARIEPLAQTLNQINSLHKKLNPLIKQDIPILWINPYFMEPKIKISFPNFEMSDYKIDYDNHPLFTKMPKGRKFGSPVRIFTNIPLKNLILPESEGYRYCALCERWVSQENRHCSECNKCTSKDGRTYTHCQICDRCVKPSWVHCTKCSRCCLPEHQCRSNSSEEEKTDNRKKLKKKSFKRKHSNDDEDDGIIENNNDQNKSLIDKSFFKEIGYQSEVMSRKERRKKKKQQNENKE